MKFLPQNPLSYCNKIGRKTYIENPLITLIREFLIVGDYPDVESVITAMKATYPIHRVNIEAALMDNNCSLVSILGIYRALTNEDATYEIVVSEISGHTEKDILPEFFDTDSCDGACVRREVCGNPHCPFGITHVLLVASSFRVFDNIEEELLHAFLANLNDPDEMAEVDVDVRVVNEWTDVAIDIPTNEIIPFIGRFTDKMFDNTYHELIKVSFSILGGEYASPY